MYKPIGDVRSIMNNTIIKELRNIKEINAQYLSGNSNVSPLCEICHKKISKEQDPVIKNNSVYCSKKCEYISLLFDPLHKDFKDLTSKVNHLINEHHCNPKILEDALNSEEYKKHL